MTVPDRVASERGAVVIHVALASLVLMGLLTFVVDGGVLWLSRNQAQNAADAAAVAGAIARAYDDVDDPPPAGGPAEVIADGVALGNRVWSEAAEHTTTVSFECPPERAGGRCVRVDVFRNGDNLSAVLPTFFASVIGVASQGVRATATAIVAPGNSTNCLRPLAIPDNWIELRPPAGEFERYDNAGALLLPTADAYDPPDAIDAGSGLTRTGASSDFGVPIQLTFGDHVGGAPIVPGYFLPLNTGGVYAEDLQACNGQMASVGQQIPLFLGALGPATTIELEGLRNQDLGASWNAATKSIEGSCAPGCAPVSPRLIAVAVFDVDAYQLKRATNDWSGCPGLPGPGAEPCVSVVNIVGFFIDSIAGPGVVDGYLTNYPGMISPGPLLSTQSSFLPVVHLVR